MKTLESLIGEWKNIKVMIYELLHTRCDESDRRIVEIFIETLDRDLINNEKLKRDKVWIMYKILESYVNELYTK